MVLKKVPRNIFDIIRQRSKTGVAMCSSVATVSMFGSQVPPSDAKLWDAQATNTKRSEPTEREGLGP